MQKKQKQIPKISDVIWKAANEFLPSEYDYYSCWSIYDAVHSYNLQEDEQRELIDQIFESFNNMGLKTNSCFVFYGVPRNLLQEYRYSWLMFAYEITLEQGV